MLSEGAIPLDDNDDSISLSDDSFMPPVLSDYANELLSDGIIKQPETKSTDDKSTVTIASGYTRTGFRPRSRFALNSNKDGSQSVRSKYKNQNTPNGTGKTMFKSRILSGSELSSKSSDKRQTSGYQDSRKSLTETSGNVSTDENNSKLHSPSQGRPSKIRFAEEEKSSSIDNDSEEKYNENGTKSSRDSSRSSSFDNKSFSSLHRSESSPPTVLHVTTKFSNFIPKTPLRKEIRNENSDKALKSIPLNVVENAHMAPPISFPQQTVTSLSQKTPFDSLNQKENHIFGNGQRYETHKNDAISEKLKKKAKNILAINGRQYQRLELIGKGGSSKVYKVQTLDKNCRVYAVKRVTFDDLDKSVIQGFKGEINLLQRLRDETRVVRLVDFEMFDTSVYLVMECGEIDLAQILSARLDMQLDLSFVRYYSQEMLKCVQAVHKHGIVHSDLKPANFLLVKGMLKIIDFGIANVVPEYTANVHRETMIGTPNYMAPEALLDYNQSMGMTNDPFRSAKYKVGKPSDVWSCGCIMYQMIYGKPPYAIYSGAQRVLAITDPKVIVQYPKQGLGGVKVPREALVAIKQCLIRDPSERQTIEKTLESSFLHPLAIEQEVFNSIFENAIRYGAQRGKDKVTEREINQLSGDVWRKLMTLSSAE